LLSRSVSTTSDPWAAGDPPDWLGDVSAGADAWTRRVSPTGAPGAGDEPIDEVSRGPEPDPESVARKILLDQLTGQARSRKELADKLAQKLVPDDIAARLLDRFEEVGLIDDAAFARLWIDSRQAGRGLARRALAQELRRKGIADEIARAALDEVDPADEEQAARALVAKKLRTMSRLDATTKTRRLVGMLARKGYSSGLALSVVREAVRAEGDAGGDEMRQSLP
jgi:regulatory protein